MADIYELRYVNGNFNALDVDDMVVIFKGNVYILNEEDGCSNTLMRLIKELCDAFPSVKEHFFYNDGALKNEFHNSGDVINAIYDYFISFPKVIIGMVDYDDNDGLSLDIENTSYNVTASPEFKQFLQSEQSKAFDKIIVNGKAVTINDTVKNPHTIQIANPLYHGTVMKHLYGILTKGLRKMQDNSIFNAKNDGFVFLTSDFAIAKSYAGMYNDDKKSPMAVLKINSDHIDKNKVVLDFDFVKEFTYPGKDDPYTSSKPYWNAFKGEIVQNSKRYGTKFPKIGYRGIVMPKAIEGVYLFDKEENPIFHTKQEIMNILSNQANESVQHINEWKPENYDSLPQKIRLYHGTDIFALEDILLDGEINARHGKRTGETYGVNWFFTSFKDNFARGVVFSIEVDKSEFENHTFEFMNGSEVTSRDSSVSIQGRNFRIEELDWYNQETFSNILKKCNGDIYDFANYIGEHNKLLNQIGEYRVDDVVILQILRQTVGEDYLRQQGVLESVNRINEVSSSDISLKSFEVQDELNPKIWVNDKLNSRVRLRLLDIADDFIDELSVRWVKPEDIILTGSIANYNWSKYSDIDVHIIIDFSKIYKKKEFVEDYFNSKKELWKRDHEDLTIYGFPVELYVQDKDDKLEAGGVYSLDKNEWIKEPKNIDDAKINEVYVKEQAAKFMTLIDNYEKDLKKETDNHKIDMIGKNVKKLLDKIKGIRKESLKRSGEMGSGNVIYKIIRRMGYLDKIWDIINNTYNKSKTIS